MFFKPDEIIQQYITNSVSKTKMTSIMIIAKSILAGLMIGMGAACSSVAAHSISNVGIARLIAGIVFPVGLMMVILMGAELFTGDCLMSSAVARKSISLFQMFRVLILVFIGNFIGSVILAALVFFCGQLNFSNGLLGAYTIKVALAKTSLTPLQGITSGILCNILVCSAVLMAMASKDVTGKILASFFVVMPFVTGGFEHCVANMYYITAGLMAKTNHNFVNMLSSYGITDISALSLKGFIVNNLLPVTFGNIVGGSIIIGLPMYYINNNIHLTKKRSEENDVHFDYAGNFSN